jgi:3-oxoacyl-[acyl-carrier-protein] synthase III
MDAYITGVGSYLPGDPVGNDEIDRYLGPPRSPHSSENLLATQAG